MDIPFGETVAFRLIACHAFSESVVAFCVHMCMLCGNEQRQTYNGSNRGENIAQTHGFWL